MVMAELKLAVTFFILFMVIVYFGFVLLKLPPQLLNVEPKTGFAVG